MNDERRKSRCEAGVYKHTASLLASGLVLSVWEPLCAPRFDRFSCLEGQDPEVNSLWGKRDPGGQAPALKVDALPREGAKLSLRATR